MSADGAMVPLMDGSWAEVKTLAIGEVTEPVKDNGELTVHTTALSYFSRLTDSDSFGRLALVETHRRGVESAQAVAAVTDGAEWLQGFIDYHRRDAVRILDFPHAAEYVSAIGAATLGDGQSPPADWFTAQLHQLKHNGSDPLLTELRALHRAHPNAPGVSEALAYLEKRVALMQYPTFQTAGWPIGSGCVESANKLVVEARLKGSGMHWQRASVNPMLALRNLVCNDRWPEAWPSIARRRRQHAL
ncbi:MAG: ISKra4 family transposase, partial [Anaerolineales bacterium]